MDNSLLWAIYSAVGRCDLRGGALPHPTLCVRYIFIWNINRSPGSILSILSCFSDLTRVLVHFMAAVAIGFFYFGRLGLFRDVSVAFVIIRGGPWDFRDAKSTGFPYEVGNVFLRLNSQYVVLIVGRD